MCGIAGWVGGRQGASERASSVRRMVEALVHRGPDEDGYLLLDEVALGMRRLSIIDLSSGKQPISDESGRFWVVQNGEIYNYREIRVQLESRGHRFRTQSDTEVIVHAYREYGNACVERLRGMFAFAIWDTCDSRLFMAVDRFGIKPLYYADTVDGLVFGSELKSLLQSGLVSREIDDVALLEYFALTFIPAPRTIFRGACKLLPAHRLTWTARDGCSVEPYWDLPPVDPQPRSTPDVQRELRVQLRHAVQSHLVSDVPLGAFLSGGMDSGSVVALMSEAGARKIKTFTIGFANPAYDERRLARLVAERYSTDHHEIVVEPGSVDLLPAIVGAFDEPFADSSALPTFHLSRLARSHVKVALSGDGGDELFLGYPIFQSLDVTRRLQWLPRFVRDPVAQAARVLPRLAPRRWRDSWQQWSKRLGDAVLPLPAAYRSKLTRIDWPTLAPLLTPEVRRRLAGRDAYASVGACLNGRGGSPGAHPLEAFVYAGLKVPLVGDMLVKVDRMSMLNSLEVRVPLLDHVLAEFAAAIPIEQRLPNWRLKGLLKDTMADALPSELLHQPKRGFAVPLAQWFRGDLGTYAQDILQGDALRRRAILDPQAIDRLLMQHAEQRTNVGTVLWSLLMFELWCQQYLP